MHEIILLSEKDVLPSKYKDENDEQSTWYLDNGASNHMTGNKSYFSELNESIGCKVKFGDESCIDIKGKSLIIFQAKTGEQRLMKDIYWIPDLKSNIISLGQATEDGCDVRLRQNYLTIHDQERILLMKVFRSPNRMYKIRLIIGTPVSLLAKLDDETWRWHARLGHVNFDSMKTMSKRKLVHGLPSFGEEKQICEGCLVGKQRRQSFPHATKFRASHKLELIHGDLCGPISPPTTVGNRYVFVLIDDFSRYMWSILLKEKSEAFEKFKTFKTMVESETGVKIKMFRTDRGGEFTSIDFQTFCENSGISRQLTAPYSPQQNGVVERRNRTLMEMTRSMLKTMKMPNYLWGEAVRHATYLINRVSTKALSDQTPYELFINHKPNLAHLRVFGCKAYAKVETVNMKKLDDRSRPLVHLGTEPSSKAYRLYDPTNKRIHVSRDMVFDESNGWSWNETVQGLVDKPGMFQLSFGDYGNHGIEGDNVEDATDNAIDRSDEVIVRSEDVIDRSETEQSRVTLRRSSRERNLPKRLEDYLLMADLIGEELLLSITWCSQKQPTVALSSCEAEFMAATAAACQAIWLQDLLHEVTGWNRESITLRVDNKSAIALTKNPVFHGRSKHIHKRYHFIRECVENEQVNVEHVSGEEQRADILTKPLAWIKFTEMGSLVGVEDLLNPSLGIKGDNVR